MSIKNPANTPEQPTSLSKQTRKISLPRSWRSVLCAVLLAALSVPAAANGHRSTSAQAEVVGAEPIYRTVEVAVPREVCRDERVDVRDNRYGRSARRSNTPGILGAIVGGALGHAVGNGNTNKKIGTAVGAILGGSIGGDIGRRNQDRNRRSQEPVSYRTERVCYEEIDYRTEQQISGYDVTYVYAGQTYTTVLADKPGRYLDVRVKVTPRSSNPRSSYSRSSYRRS